MQGDDYRKKYVTCDEYEESNNVTSDVDLLTAFTEVSEYWNSVPEFHGNLPLFYTYRHA
jgi:hypothetical protein